MWLPRCELLWFAGGDDRRVSRDSCVPPAPQFVFYDFHSPLDVPRELLGACAGCVVDPPYLNPECLGAFSATVASLSLPGAPVMLCTGAVMCAHARALLGARPTHATLEHDKARLSNPFACYVTYGDAAALGGWNTELEEAEGVAAAAPPPS